MFSVSIAQVIQGRSVWDVRRKFLLYLERERERERERGVIGSNVWERCPWKKTFVTVLSSSPFLSVTLTSDVRKADMFM